MSALRAARSSAAYSIINLAAFAESVHEELVEDAAAGGKIYGVRVVEEYINGPVRQVVYGVYHVDQELWEEAKAQLGIEEEALEAEEPDEEALRKEAEAKAADDADRLEKARTAQIEKVVGAKGDTADAADTAIARSKRSGR